jgi:hypothetical protein
MQKYNILYSDVLTAQLQYILSNKQRKKERDLHIPNNGQNFQYHNKDQEEKCTSNYNIGKKVKQGQALRVPGG